MPLPQERIETLALKKQVKTIAQLLQNAYADIASNEPHRLDRFRNVFNWTSPLFLEPNIEHTAVSVYESISKELEEARIELQKFSGNPHEVHYDQLDNICDNILRFVPLVGPNERSIERIENLINQAIEAKDRVVGNFSELEQSSNRRYSSFIESAKAYLANLEKLELDGTSLVELAAGKVQEKDFGTRATQEKDKAFWWTVATWIASGLTIVMLGIVFILHIKGLFAGREADYGLLGTQALITITLGLIAKWSSKRANRHLTEEAKYHRLSVNLMTLRPFIANLDKATQDAIIADIARYIFTDPASTDINTEYDSSPILDPIKNLLQK